MKLSAFIKEKILKKKQEKCLSLVFVDKSLKIWLRCTWILWHEKWNEETPEIFFLKASISNVKRFGVWAMVLENWTWGQYHDKWGERQLKPAQCMCALWKRRSESVHRSDLQDHNPCIKITNYLLSFAPGIMRWSRFHDLKVFSRSQESGAEHSFTCNRLWNILLQVQWCRKWFNRLLCAPYLGKVCHTVRILQISNMDHVILIVKMLQHSNWWRKYIEAKPFFPWSQSPLWYTVLGASKGNTNFAVFIFVCIK